jgi:uncharacterized protein with HEPN domain/predicted nucleotidyltransferase
VRRAEALRRLAEHREELAALGVDSLALFGSVARDEAGPNSDVDLLVDVRRGTGLFGFVGIQQRLEEILGSKVDLVSRPAIKRQLREQILSEQVPVFGVSSDGDGKASPGNGRSVGANGHDGRGNVMPKRNRKMRIEDILEAIEKIERYTAGMDFEAFAANEMAADAVTHNLAIIGEAARHVPPEVQARYPTADWAKMRGMRNVLVHDYPSVDLTIVRDVVRNYLPPLVPLLREILEREP